MPDNVCVREFCKLESTGQSFSGSLLNRAKQSGTLLHCSVLTVFHLAWSLGHTLQSSSHPTRMQYSRELLLRWNVQGSPGDLTNPVVLLRSGYQKPPGGHSVRPGSEGEEVTLTQGRKQLSHILLPSIILSNTQSLRNKSEELLALMRFNQDFSESCILAFTESQLSNWDSDADLEINGFGTPIRLDRCHNQGQVNGCRVCLYVNELNKTLRDIFQYVNLPHLFYCYY